MKSVFKHDLQHYFNQQSLSTRQLQQLHQLQHRQTKQYTQVWLKPFMAVTAVVILMFGFLTMYDLPSATSIEQRIAVEVANNHLKLKPLEISTGALSEIKNYFKQLDFLPISPAFLASSSHSLMGGRYCSIQGVTAVQLRLVDDKTGQVHSLYETQYDKRIFKDLPILANATTPLAVYANGMKVSIWVEKDILFALTD